MAAGGPPTYSPAFWSHVLDYMGLPYDEDSKAAVKRGTYGLVYGAAPRRIVSAASASPASSTAFGIPQITQVGPL